MSLSHRTLATPGADQAQCTLTQSPGVRCFLQHIGAAVKIAVQRRSVSNLTELERICREEWEKLSKYRCAKLVASHPRRLRAVITAKGASTKYLVKGLNTYVNVIFQ